MTIQNLAKSLLASVALLATLSGVARAQRHNPLEGQPPVRRHKELRAGRFFLGPYTGASLLSDYKNTYLLGGQAEYYIFDWLSVGGGGAVGFNSNTSLTSRLASVLPCADMAMGAPAGCTRYLQNADGSYNFDRATPTADQFYQHLNQIAWMADLHAGYTPLWGKVSLAGYLFADYDLELQAGLGIINYTNGFPASENSGVDPIRTDPMNAATRLGPLFGVEMHFFMNDWMAIDIGLKDIWIEDNPAGFDINRDRKVGSDDLSLQQKFFVTIGLVFYLPPSVDISP